MRLAEFEAVTLSRIFKEIFENGDIYLFGSRVDDSQKAEVTDWTEKFILTLEDCKFA